MAQPKKVILLVDDHEQALSVRKFLLETHGYRVLPALTPHVALELAERALPGGIDLLLTDFVLPGMDGNELCRRVRAIRPETRTLIVSGLVTLADRVDAADAFLPKGACTSAEILDRVKSLCARKRGPKKPPQSVTTGYYVHEEIA